MIIEMTDVLRVRRNSLVLKHHPVQPPRLWERVHNRVDIRGISLTTFAKLIVEFTFPSDMPPGVAMVQTRDRPHSRAATHCRSPAQETVGVCGGFGVVAWPRPGAQSV